MLGERVSSAGYSGRERLKDSRLICELCFCYITARFYLFVVLSLSSSAFQISVAKAGLQGLWDCWPSWAQAWPLPHPARAANYASLPINTSHRAGAAFCCS